MNLQKLLDTTPEALASTQFYELKKATLDHLNKIVNFIKVEDFKAVNRAMSESLAGDDMGSDNCYIDFSDIHPSFSDLNTVIDKLKLLYDLKSKTTPAPWGP